MYHFKPRNYKMPGLTCHNCKQSVEEAITRCNKLYCESCLDKMQDCPSCEKKTLSKKGRLSLCHSCNHVAANDTNVKVNMVKRISGSNSDCAQISGAALANAFINRARSKD